MKTRYIFCYTPSFTKRQMFRAPKQKFYKNDEKLENKLNILPHQTTLNFYVLV